jgi:Uncharacterized protein conserved in bacteria (DUF2188)
VEWFRVTRRSVLTGRDTPMAKILRPLRRRRKLLNSILEKIEENAMSKSSQHVVRDPDGGWSVKKGGSVHATKRFVTQKEAITYGRRISKAQGSELYVHGRDGMIRSKDSYGNDPNPPKEKR